MFVGVLFVYFLFFDLVQAGGSLVFDFDLSGGMGLPMSVMVYVDWASVMFSLSVLFISSSIFWYCCFYMAGEVNPERFCWLVVLFVVFMNLFIFMPSVLGMMLGWDGLGVVSFALVAYYKNRESLGAGNITVLTGRVGDACLVVLIACTVSNMSWHWFDMQYQLGIWCMMLVIVASITKSAQVPFSAWLPAAMAAPTPVSALVHSSTLVTAGVYVLFRYYPCFEGVMLVLLSFIATATMLMSGLVATLEIDLKKVVAFSTLSQLGLMVLAISASQQNAGMFHLLTHAFYKSLMFLCVGAVIYKGAGLQDARLFSGLWFKMPAVSAWLVVTCMCLSGLPFTSGFYSKHSVVEGCLFGEISQMGAWCLYLSIFLTAVYSWRLVNLMTCFHGYGVLEKYDSGKYEYWSMLLPLFCLGLVCLFVGYVLLGCFSFLNAYSFSPICVQISLLLINFIGVYVGLNKTRWEQRVKPSFSMEKSRGVVRKSLCKLVKGSWFLPQMTGNVMASVGLSLAVRMYLLIEKGWLEGWFWVRWRNWVVSLGKFLFAASHHPKVASLYFLSAGMVVVAIAVIFK
uniref:NADH dehydrogenase subunit 5 n=1 Tax=Kuphus polythalamius TaxID=1049060 RepID=UPI0020285A3A|nr:NADH dehydrogenase subunit 5 [Kuphus polythalamius]UPX89195.1 NADH dehydrogenase subunit 5 [Kuphus polythalamius]UPX89207.1 NADH dehydrogenase subunit 5 [Kuphus polythalamius]